MNYLKDLENKSIYIIREAFADFKKPAILWSMGKDSCALLWLCRKAFFGNIPFPVIHIDTGFKFPEMYDFRDKYSKEWNLKLIIIENNDAKKIGIGPKKGNLECCTALKTEALKMCLKKYGFDSLLLAIRRDEHGIRAKERVFSPRDKAFKWDYKNQPLEMWDQYQSSNELGIHTRIHPILDWSELDIWEFILRENIPVNPLYFSKNGKRYRSLGCKPCTSPIDSEAVSIPQIIMELKETKIAERSGRAQDKEKAFMMQKLRALGYM